MSNVVVVESPAKAKTIHKYLGSEYTIIASLGHVRDLPPKDGSVDPNNNFEMIWQSDERGNKQVTAIAKALKNAKNLYLATDPDREGEAISWHILAMLEERHALKNIHVQRITFHEITKNAIRYAVDHPRHIDMPLVEAYLARRALDYLVGFTLSPVLWHKLPGSRSAGRVQSVALRLVCEREAEIEMFKPREYWNITASFLTQAGAAFTARLTHLNGHKLDQFDLANAEQAEKARQAVETEHFSVHTIERRTVRRNPYPPFTTSTLQQEASRKLGMTAQNTMRTAQQLYEGVDLDGETVGLITYMRTDGTTLSEEAIHAIRHYIDTLIGNTYVPSKPRIYTSKVKNAQEAHEAIRPTDVLRTPDSVAPYLTYEQKRLYELIWKRAVASQMESALFDQVAINISNASSAQTIFRANGSIMTFDGFLHLYREGQDDTEEIGQDESRLLPPMQEQESLTHDGIKTEQHFTQPPPRFSEASLVKKLEELGIGRPSTYASILEVLQDRHYVKLENRRFIPETRGRIVTTFLVLFFERYVNTGFTAEFETLLDDISDGRAQWKYVLESFWKDFSKAIADTKELKNADVIDALDKTLEPFFFPPRSDGLDPRQCHSCQSGRLGLKLGKHGAFIGCSHYPECRYTCDISNFMTSSFSKENSHEHTFKDGIYLLGQHPLTKEDITLRQGPWGLYLQQGASDSTDKKEKVKRKTLPKNISEKDITLEQAIGLLSLPRIIGLHPETNEPIEADIGRFGPFVKMGSVYSSLDKDDDIFTVGINRAVDALAKKMSSIRVLGQHPVDHQPVTLHKGRFAPYIQHGSIRANLSRDTDIDTVTLDDALTFLTQNGKPFKAKAKTPKKTSSKEKKASTSSKKVQKITKSSVKTATKPHKTVTRLKKKMTTDVIPNISLS